MQKSYAYFMWEFRKSGCEEWFVALICTGSIKTLSLDNKRATPDWWLNANIELNKSYTVTQEAVAYVIDFLSEFSKAHAYTAMDNQELQGNYAYLKTAD